MKDEFDFLSHYTDPFSKKVEELSEQFDNATICRNYEELERSLSEAENKLCNENIASQARIYYSMGTVYSDFAQFKCVSNKKSIEKQLYYFRKSISLIEIDEYSEKSMNLIF